MAKRQARRCTAKSKPNPGLTDWATEYSRLPRTDKKAQVSNDIGRSSRILYDDSREHRLAPKPSFETGLDVSSRSNLMVAKLLP